LTPLKDLGCYQIVNSPVVQRQGAGAAYLDQLASLGEAFMRCTALFDGQFCHKKQSAL